MPSIFNAHDAAAYELVMGRWSRLLAPDVVAFAGCAPGQRILDVGCGTGALAEMLLARAPAEVVGIDYAEDYVAAARRRASDARLSFCRGDACALPFPTAHFDRAIAQLVLPFIPRPDQALAEMCRVTRPGGVVAGAAWEVRGGMPGVRLFMDTAAMLDPAAAALRQRYMAVPIAAPGEMAALWRAAGLVEVEEASAHARFGYAGFEDYWAPLMTGEGMMGGYVVTLPPDRRETLRQALRAAYEAGAGDGPREFVATAMLCRGTAS